MQNSCQKIVTALQEDLDFFNTELFAAIKDKKLVNLSLSSNQLALLLPKTSNVKPTIAINSLPPTEAAKLHKLVLAWSSLFNLRQNWYLITDTISDQEKSGIAHTSLSYAMHKLMMANINKSENFIISISKDNNLPDPKKYLESSIKLTAGEKIKTIDLSRLLTDAGYIRYESSIESGGYRIRGEQIDISHPAIKGHHTITLYGSNIESITHHLNLRSKNVNSILIPPLKFPKSTQSLNAALSNFIVFKPNHLQEITGSATIVTDALNPSLSFPFTETKASERKITGVFYNNRDRINKYLSDRPQSNVELCQSALADFPLSLEGSNIWITSESTIFPPQAKTPPPISYQEGVELLAQLKIGKPAVHDDHGVGVYEGLQQRLINNVSQEYLVLRYKDGDTLSVPVTYAHKITPYIGDSAPLLHKLDGTSWVKTKKKAKEDAVKFARELLVIARKRTSTQRAPYQIHDGLDRNLTKSSGFTLTPDQEKTWEEIKADLRNNIPIDRLIVGDVGFGKTEIALRTAAQAVANGKQVALLAPTTLLVQQHLDTFTARLPHLKKSIHSLSRFASPAQRKEVRAAISSQKAKIVIGTQALLSKKTEWANLGLVIIDEEQRFGVRQKEHFKELRSHIDMISMSATPIPRTLSMALSGLQNLSIISTPPEGRKNVQTFIHKNEDDVIKKAIAKEIKRGGQVYVVAPKIRHLAPLNRRINVLLPSVKMAMAHGQMESKKLAGIMRDFDTGKIDLLLSSNIVANGLDLPRANTIIVINSTQFGLSELYQLRGRVGRRKKQGAAHFLYNQSNLTTLQRQRLTALTEATRLGSGWDLARRDLEIRGAGNLLGAEQSGSVNAIGVQLYLDLINQAVEESPESNNESDIQLPLAATIPTHYISSTEDRTHWYHKLSRSKNEKVLFKLKDQLQNEFGPLPQETNNLILLINLQKNAAKLGISKISSTEIKPLHDQPFKRISISGKDLPTLLSRLDNIGITNVKNDIIEIDLPHITTNTVADLTYALK